MSWAALTLAATAVGMAFKLIFVNKSLASAKNRIDILARDNSILRAEKLDCMSRSEARASVLRDEIRKRDETISEITSPDGQRDSLNELL